MPLKPYNPDQPDTAWGKLSSRILNEQRSAIETRKDLTADQKILGTGAIETVRQLVARIGGAPPPNHPAYPEYERLKTYIRTLTEPVPVPPAGAPPAPAARQESPMITRIGGTF